MTAREIEGIMGWMKRLASGFLGGAISGGSRRKGTAPRGRRVAVEALEDRRLLSVNWLEHPFDSNLSVHFTADMNADGAVDIVCHDRDEDQYFWREVNSAIEHPIGKVGLRSVADVNGDEFPDFLTLIAFATPTQPGRFGWCENDGRGGFTEHTIGEFWGFHTFADANGDGFLDFVVTFGDSEFGWYENDGSGNFTERRIPDFIENIWHLRAADMNGDGHMDLLTKSPQVGITLHLNDGNYVYTDHVVTDKGDLPVVQDLDADGDLDMLQRSTDDDGDDLVWYENDGQGEFREHSLPTSDIKSIAGFWLADLNGDRHTDIVAEVSPGEIVSYVSNGQGDFSRSTVWSDSTTYNTKIFSGNVYITDVTGDGHSDIVQVWFKENYEGSRMVSESSAVDWYEYDGNGRFNRNVLVPLTSSINRGLYAEDFDGDGDIDILGLGPDVWYENLSSTDFREIPSVDPSTNEYRYGFASRRGGLVTVDATFDPAAGDVTLRLVDKQGQLINEITGSDGYLRIDHPDPTGGNAYELQITGTNTSVNLRICNLVSQTGSDVTVFDTTADDRFGFSISDTYNVTANGVEYQFDDADTFVFNSTAGDDFVELFDSDGDDTLTVSSTQMTMAGTTGGGTAYSATASGCAEAHGYAKEGGQDVALFTGTEGRDRAKAYEDFVKLMGSGYYARAKFFEEVQVDTGEGEDSAVVVPSDGVDVLWAKKNDMKVSHNVELAGEPAFATMDYGVSITNAEFLVARARGGDDWVELHDSVLNDVVIAKPHKIEIMNAPRPAEDVDRAQEYCITARNYQHATAIADQGGDNDVAKLYDSAELGIDLWQTGYVDGQTWSSMLSPTRLLYEVLAFEQVGGYGLNGGLGEGHGINRKDHASGVDFVFEYGFWQTDPVTEAMTSRARPRLW